jgi:hypothetical protein
MQGITVVNGYEVDIKTVARAQRNFEARDLPAISVFDGIEETNNLHNVHVETMTVNDEIHGDAGTIANRSTYANTLMADIKKAGILSDEHGGYAVGTYLNGGTINYPLDDDSTNVNVVVIFNIKYEEIVDNPYAKP